MVAASTHLQTAVADRVELASLACCASHHVEATVHGGTGHQGILQPVRRVAGAIGGTAGTGANP